jgi:hypothetical protein
VDVGQRSRRSSGGVANRPDRARLHAGAAPAPQLAGQSRRRPDLVVHPLAEAAAFSRLDRDGRPPEGALSLDCADEGVAYGLLAHAGRLRLFRMVGDPGSAATTTSDLELDVTALRAVERPLLGLLAPDSLRPGGHFERLVDDARPAARVAAMGAVDAAAPCGGTAQWG